MILLWYVLLFFYWGIGIGTSRGMPSILLVYTTSVDIDQRFIVSDVSIPQSGTQYMYEWCVWQLYTCKLCKYTFKNSYFVLLPSVPFQSFHVTPRPKFQSFHEMTGNFRHYTKWLVVTGITRNAWKFQAYTHIDTYKHVYYRSCI